MSLTFILLKRRHFWFRPDTLPFILGYLLLLVWQIQIGDEDGELQSVYARLILIGLVFVHSLTFLSSYWSSHLKARIQYSSGPKKITKNSLKQYSYVKAYHCKASGSYCDIIPTNEEVYFIRFMENKYIFDEEKYNFIRLKPDVHFDLLTLGEKLKSQNLNIKSNMFDKNSLLVPMKNFNQILKEQLMEPFSFFQIISLWLLDENSLYALFTLGLLFVTGCTVAIQRMRTMLTLRQMKLNHQYIQVFRNKQWIKLSSEELIPGDIIILQSGESTKPVLPPNQLEPNQQQQQQQQQFRNPHPLLQPVTLTEDEQWMRDQVPFKKYLPMRLFKTEAMNVDSYKSLPCDVLLLSGTVVVNEAMLTGESVPQVKDSVEHIHHSENLEIKGKHKQNVLFCGTEIVQIQGTINGVFNIPPPKYAQSLGLVLRTGFDTAKGKLIRTVFYNNENAQVKQLDGLVIVLVLLIFALISSANVLYFGLHDPSRDKNKLFLRCILIVTTVVPPELPMILSIAVNQSLLFLQIRKIFCTEPYRIPLAGKVTVLAFDKTGTLTNDQLKFVGIVDDCSIELKQRHQSNLETQSVLAGCHSLIFADSKLQGDPIELLFFNNNPTWNYQAPFKTSYNNSNKREIMIRQVYSFKSDLKRMSTLVIQEDQNNIKTIKLLTKGAPESLIPLLKVVPNGFTECYEYFTNLGYRVLCLADRILDDQEFGIDNSLFPMQKTALYGELDRSDLEKNLNYRGLLICESPLKPDTALWLEKFRRSYFNSIIITGDNMLTAIAVAKQVGLDLDRCSKKRIPLILEVDPSKNFIWRLDKSTYFQIGQAGLILESCQQKKLTHMLCISSESISALEGFDYRIFTYFTVFARASPKQKEQIIIAIKRSGAGVLMCGDGTNDVGGLKKADVGIALVTKNNVSGEEEKEKDDDDDNEESAPQLSFSQQFQKIREQQEEMRKKMIQQQQQTPQQTRLAAQQAAQQSMNEATKDLFGMSSTYKFGDACIAAPFTSKMSTSIRCVHTVLKQGVCTLVTTIQTYKIMALLSLINAYSLSSLHMQVYFYYYNLYDLVIQSLKLSSNQMTIMGIFGTAYYFCYSSAKPQRYLSSVKPSASIFEFSFIISLIAQITLHIYTMDYALHQIAIPYSNEIELEVDNDEEFKPTFLNSVVFLIQMLQQSCIFLFNHPGEPHMRRLDIESKFFKSLIIPLIICILGSLNIFDDINYYFELKFPNQNPDKASNELGILCIFIVITNYLIERVMKYCKYGQFYGYI